MMTVSFSRSNHKRSRFRWIWRLLPILAGILLIPVFPTAGSAAAEPAKTTWSFTKGNDGWRLLGKTRKEPQAFENALRWESLGEGSGCLVLQDRSQLANPYAASPPFPVEPGRMYVVTGVIQSQDNRPHIYVALNEKSGRYVRTLDSGGDRKLTFTESKEYPGWTEFRFVIPPGNIVRNDRWAYVGIRPAPKGESNNYLGEVKIRRMTWEATENGFLSLAQAANVGFQDEAADDGKGGWTDQGKNDLRGMRSGVQTFAGVRFNVIDPADNAGRSVLAMERNGGRYAKEADIDVGNRKFDRIYLLQTAAWIGRAGDNPGIATAYLLYENGKTVSQTVAVGRDVNDWFGGGVTGNAATVPLSNANPTRDLVQLYVMTVDNPHPDWPIKSLKLRSDSEVIWLVLAATGSSGSPALIRSNTEKGVVMLNLTEVRKDLSQSLVGADAEDLHIGIDGQWLMNEGLSQFEAFCKASGIRVLRLGNMSRYSVRGEEVSKKMAARFYSARTSRNSEEGYRKRLAGPYNYLDPERFYQFCQQRHIDVIPMIDGRVSYDPQTKETYFFVNQPEYYEKAAKEAAYQVQWVKQHGYADTAVAWEIGNEPYGWWAPVWKPQEYAKFVRLVIQETRKIDPDIRLALAFQPEKNTHWTKALYAALGEDAKYITYGVIHLYNDSASYNSIRNADLLAQSLPNTRHLQFICTEWRWDWGGQDLVKQRQFAIGGLWSAKFAMMMMAYPKMQYTGIHALFSASGLGFYSNGQNWVMQQHNSRVPGWIQDTERRQRILTGPFAVPMRMLNSLIETHPLMLRHHAGLGHASSVMFYKWTNGKGNDVEYIVSTNEKRDSLAAVIVNTNSKKQKILFRPSSGDIRAAGNASVETYTCDLDKLCQVELPSDAVKYVHDKTTIQPADKPVTLPPFSVVKVVVPLTK